jgi:hypothetical protein
MANPDLMQQFMNTKVNNDILIPRSILKRNLNPVLSKLKHDDNQFDFIDELEDIDNANLLYNEAVVGR